MSKVTMTKRFYVGTDRINSNPEGMMLLGEAIVEASRRTAKDGITRHVVEVVRVIRPDKPPVIVEEVRK